MVEEAWSKCKPEDQDCNHCKELNSRFAVGFIQDHNWVKESESEAEAQRHELL